MTTLRTVSEGTSYVVAALARGYRARGYRFIGLAWCSAAARDLQAATQLDACFAASEWVRLVQEKVIHADAKTALVILNQGQLSRSDRTAVLALARGAGAKALTLGAFPGRSALACSAQSEDSVETTTTERNL